jgi:hypothetical protein
MFCLAGLSSLVGEDHLQAQRTNAQNKPILFYIEQWNIVAFSPFPPLV